MNVSDYKDAGPHKFDKAHVVLWTTIRAKISEKDPSASLDTGKTDIEELIQDLHPIDDKWFGNKELRKDLEK